MRIFYKVGLLLAIFSVFTFYAQAQRTLLAGWTFDATVAQPNTPRVQTANLGVNASNSQLLLDGTFGSSSWIAAASGNELTVFGGSTIGDPRNPTVAGQALSLIGGTGQSANGKSVVFRVFTGGLYSKFRLSFSTRGTSTGFSTHAWAYGTDGTNYTTLGGNNTANTTATFTSASVDLTSVNALTGSQFLYIRLTVSGSSTATGNNRLDNILITSDDCTWQGTTNSSAATLANWLETGLNSGFSGFSLPVSTSNVIVNASSNPMQVGANTTYDSIIVNDGGSLSVASGFVLNCNSVIVRSTASNTSGHIANTAGTISSDNGITVQRFIPLKTSRKWNFVASPVSVNVRDSWQQQTFVTGAGTGGTPCGTGTGNGGANDRYNSNGFDATINNSGTIFTYDGSVAGGGLPTRWVPITNTTTLLTPGKGYRMNIRGTRGAADANCTNLLTTGTPNAPDAVTLATTGAITNTVNSGTISVTLDGANNDFTLLGNPYPSTLDFDAFRATNSTGIFDGFWLYSPQVANSNYTTVNGNTATNAPSGETAATLKRLASGQAFFVQNIGTAGQTVSFQESHKLAGNAGNFRTTQAAAIDYSNTTLRVGLLNTNADLLDEFVVRFGTDANISSTAVTTQDAVNISDFVTAVATLKNNRRFAIQSRTAQFTSDTVQVDFRASAVGNYQFKASEHTVFTTAESILLVDNFTQTTTDLKLQPTYNFAVSTNPASVGASRFYLVFRGAATLPVNFTNLFASYIAGNTVQVKWQVAAENNVEKYMVESSNNGTQFTPVATVLSNGNSTAPVQYTASHHNAFTGISYYRVVAVAKDGTKRVSAVVKVSKTGVAPSVTMLSNPVGSTATVQLQGIKGAVTVQVSQVSGAKMLQYSVAAQQGLVALPVSNFSAGVYLVSVVTENKEVFVTKFIKQ